MLYFVYYKTTSAGVNTSSVLTRDELVILVHSPDVIIYSCVALVD